MHMSSIHIIPGSPVRRTIGSISAMKPILKRFVTTSIFFLPYFLIRNGATRFGQNEALPDIAIISEYWPGEHAP